MNDVNLPSNPDLPASYEISVRGKLDTSWSDWFDQMTLIYNTDDDGLAITMMVGTITDQAALHGLLAKIRDLGLTILSINRVGLNEP